MIAFWVTAALLTVAIVALLALPLLRRASTLGGPGGTDLAVYRDQLTELERDRARGLIEPEQAGALQTEIGRRMLAAARADETNTAPAARPSKPLTAALAIVVPLAAFGLYLMVGHPEMPAQPLAQRTIGPGSDPVKVLASVNKLRAVLKPIPDDLGRWVIVGKAYLKLEHAKEAVDAFRNAVAIDPKDPTLRILLGESLVQSDGGAVGPEAKQLFGTIPDDAGDIRFEARYFLALADQQAGDNVSALTGFQKLLSESQEDSPNLELLRTRIAELALIMGLNPLRVTPNPKPVPAAAPTQSGAPGPTTDDVAASSNMTPEQRLQMIKGMVAGLAAKLNANPNDADGWRRLGRAYDVLGEADKAKDAMARAQAVEGKSATPP